MKGYNEHEVDQALYPMLEKIKAILDANPSKYGEVCLDIHEKNHRDVAHDGARLSFTNLKSGKCYRILGSDYNALEGVCYLNIVEMEYATHKSAVMRMLKPVYRTTVSGKKDLQLAFDKKLKTVLNKLSIKGMEAT